MRNHYGENSPVPRECLGSRLIVKPRRVVVGLIVLFLWSGLASVQAVNRDGKTDIYWRNYSSGDDSAWRMDGVTYSSSATLGFQGDPGWKMVGTGDFNNDGDLDLLWRNSSTGRNVVWYQCAALFMSSKFIQALTDTDWEIVGTGYFEGLSDSGIDILWRNKVTGDNAIWFMDGANLRATASIQELPDLGWKVGGTGDFNNDGHTDIVWRHATTGVNYVWHMEGANLVTTAQLQSESDGNWEIVGAGYFSGANDSTVDLLWRHKTNGDNSIWQLNGVSLVSTHALPWAAASWKVGGTGDARVDSDNDSLPDIWERRFFGNLTNSSAGDPDGDGQSNLQEYQNGSHPSVSNALPLLGNALDSSTRVWTTGGNASWFHQTNDWYSGGSAARSGALTENQSSWLETQIQGPGSLSFLWKVSSQAGSDWINFTISGGGNGWSGIWGWDYRAYVIGPGTYTARWTYSTDSSGFAGANAGFVDSFWFSQSGNNDNASPNSLAEAVDELSLSLGGSCWQHQTSTSYYGGDSARGYFTWDDSFEDMGTTVTGPGVLSFYWKVSCEQNYDFLSFLINGQEVDLITGEVDWTQRSFALPAGSVNLKWRYSKDYSYSGGEDSGWVDKVVWVPDEDSDGLSDGWETQYFGGTSSQNGTGDFDADGFNNLLEYLNGTNPTLAELRVKIASPRKYSLLP